MHGAVERVRPKMMTVVAIMAGLLPILWSTSTGSEVMRRIAVPMVDSMVSSTFLTLLVIPAVYAIIKGWGLPHRAEARAPTNRPERILAECAHTPMLSRVSPFDRGVGQLRQAGEDIVVLSLSLENTTKKLLHADATARLRPDTRQ